MAGFTDYNREGTLTLNSVSLNNPAFMAGGDETGAGTLLQLWGFMTALRGSDVLIPAAAGVIPYVRRRTVTEYAVRLLVNGDVNASGVENADDRVGLQTNLDTLRTLVDTHSTGDGTVTVNLTRFTGAALTGVCHVLSWVPSFISYSDNGFDGSYAEGLLNLSFPTGRPS